MTIYRLCVVILLGLMLPAGLLAQSEWSMNLGFSAWPNNCDVPSGGQDSHLQPSFGPFFSLNKGHWQFGGTFFKGHFDIEPEHAIELDATGQPVFSDEHAREHGFTSDGWTERIDVDLNVGYRFNRYAKLSFSFVINRHEADVVTYWGPVLDNDGNIILPSDPSLLRDLRYTDTQFWIGQNFSGSIPIETVSARFSIFYNASLLVLAGENGDGVFEQPIGTLNETTPRTTYADEDGNVIFPPRSLGTRSFGDNLGITFSTGAGFQLFNNPATVIFGGYNVKFYDEKQNSFIDHSVFKGPFVGISVNVF